MHFAKKLYGCFFVWKVQPAGVEDLLQADVVIGQAFGLQREGPGLSNAALAEAARTLWTEYGLPLVLQSEIARAVGVPVEAVIREHRTTDQYLDTREVLEQAAIVCRERGWKRVVILAHPDHAWRVARMAERLGLQVCIRAVDAPYDPESAQWWTRGWQQFVPRELAARLFCLLKGWI